IGGAERRAVEGRERARRDAAGGDAAPVLDERLREAHERREDEPGARAADAAGEQHVELPAEADDDQRRRPAPREGPPAACEPARRGGEARAEPGERRRAEVRGLLRRRLLPERLVALDDVPPRAGEREAEETVRAVGADVRAEQARGHRTPRFSARSGRSGVSRTTEGASPSRSSISRT